MPLTWNEIQSNAVAFSKRWQSGGKEKQETWSFKTKDLRKHIKRFAKHIYLRTARHKPI